MKRLIAVCAALALISSAGVAFVCAGGVRALPPSDLRTAYPSYAEVASWDFMAGEYDALRRVETSRGLFSALPSSIRPLRAPLIRAVCSPMGDMASPRLWRGGLASMTCGRRLRLARSLPICQRGAVASSSLRACSGSCAIGIRRVPFPACFRKAPTMRSWRTPPFRVR